MIREACKKLVGRCCSWKLYCSCVTYRLQTRERLFSTATEAEAYNLLNKVLQAQRAFCFTHDTRAHTHTHAAVQLKRGHLREGTFHEQEYTHTLVHTSVQTKTAGSAPLGPRCLLRMPNPGTRQVIGALHRVRPLCIVVCSPVRIC